MRRLALLVASLMLAIGLAAWPSPAAVVIAQDAGYEPDGEEWAFVELINGYRGSLGLGPVAMNYELGAAADYHSVDMGINNYFDHYLFDGTDPGTNIQNFGYTGSPWGETIAAGMGTAQEVLIAWQNSPEHNAAMTNPAFTEIGVGRYYAEGSYYGWYWTATYGGGEAQTAPEPLPAPVEAADDGTLLTLTELEGDAAAAGETTTVTEPATVSTTEGGVVELEQGVVNADGDRAVSTGVNPTADGTGETIIYGDINTGGVMGETIVYEPPSLNVSGETTSPAPEPAPVSEAPPPAPATTEPAPASGPTTVTRSEPGITETTTTNITMDDGTGQAIG